MGLRLVACAMILGILAGCVGPLGSSVVGGEAESLPAVGSMATYLMTIGAGRAEVSVQAEEPHRFSFPDSTTARVVPFRIELREGAATHVRVAEVSLRTGALMVIGDLSLNRHGSEQYDARTRAWAGSPEGPLDPFRCLAGVLLPVALGERIEPLDSEIPLGKFATWIRESEGQGDIIGADGLPVGEFRMWRGSGFWPTEATWTHGSGGQCKLSLVQIRIGTQKIEWGQSDERQHIQLTKVPILARIPPMGEAKPSISLEEADAAVAGDPRTGPFLRDRPQAWLIIADYRGRWSVEGASDTDAQWSLVYADPTSAEYLWASVERTALGTLMVTPLGDLLRPPFSFNKNALQGGVVAFSEVTGPDGGFPAPPPGGRVVISWLTATSAAELGTADAGMWQYGWDSPEGWRSYLFSAVDGVPVARVISPELRGLVDPGGLS